MAAPADPSADPPAGLPLADTSDMIQLHRVFREALSAAPRFVGQAPEDDRGRAETVGSYYANVLDLLHSHHEGEDELLTPRLLQRVPEHAETVTRIGGQHQVVLGAVDAAEKAVATWRSEPSGTNRAAAEGALTALDAALTPHLDEEERDILPIAATCINVAEWGQLPEHGMKNFRGDKLWLIMGLVQEQMSPEQRAAMEAHMPPPLVQFWNTAGRDQFDAFVAELRS